MKHKAIILGSNYYIGLSLIRCLGRIGVHTVVMDYSKKGTYGAASKFLSEQFIVPHYKKEEEAFINYLIGYAKKETCKPVLFPSADPYVEVIDKHLDVLKDYYLIPMTTKDLWRQLMDKGSLHDLAKIHGVKVPESVDPYHPEFRTIFEETIGFPCLVKPTDSPKFVAHFRKKMFKCHDESSLKEALEQSKNAGMTVVVQRIIEGFDDHMFTYDVYLNQQSEVTHYMTCQKLRQFPINYGASAYTIQRHVPELHKIGGKFLKAVGYKGFAEIEFKYDDHTDDYYLIEVNVRTTTLNEMLYQAGINFPEVAYMEMIDQPLQPCFIEQSTDLAFRYHIEDLIASKNYIKSKQQNFLDIFKSLRRRKVYAIWSIKDPKPYFKYWASKIFK